MALLDNVEQRVDPNYEFPIVAEAAIVAYLALSKPVPETIISAVIAVNAKKILLRVKL